jgi:zinc protease
MMRRLVLVSLCATMAHDVLGQSLDRTKRPVAPPPGSFTAPKVTLRTLANGLRVAVVENHALPVVTVRVELGVDSTLDPPTMPGLATVTVSMLGEGTTTMRPARRDSIEATLGTQIRATGFTTIPQNLEPSLALLRDLVVFPAFDDSALVNRKAARETAVRNQIGLLGVARPIFYSTLYGPDAPVARHATVEALTRLTRDTVVSFYSAHVRPERTVLVVVGDVATEAAVSAVSRSFGAWTRPATPASRSAEAAAAYTMTAVSPTTIYLVDTEALDTTRALIFVGQRGPSRSSADVATVIDELTSILNTRGKDSLHADATMRYAATPIAAVWRSPPVPGSIHGSMYVNSTDVRRALARWLWVLRSVDEGLPPTDDELQAAHASQIEGFPARFETTQSTAAQVADLLRDHLPLDFFDEYVRRGAALTAENIVRAAHTYLDPSHLTIVVAGDRKRIEPNLRAANIAPIVVLDATGKPIP